MRGVATTLHCPRCGDPQPALGGVSDTTLVTCRACTMSFSAASGTRAAPRGARRRRDDASPAPAPTGGRNSVIVRESSTECELSWPLTRSVLVMMFTIALMIGATAGSLAMFDRPVEAAVCGAFAAYAVYLCVATAVSRHFVRVDAAAITVRVRPLPRWPSRRVASSRIRAVDVEALANRHRGWARLTLRDGNRRALLVLRGDREVELTMVKLAIERTLGLA